MNRDALSFDLPTRLIAQSRVANPKKIKLLVLSRKDDRIIHRNFVDLPEYLNEGDALALNDTAVIPARMWGSLDVGGQVEVTLVTKIKNETWEALVRPDIRLKAGRRIFFKKYGLNARIIKKTEYDGWALKFNNTGKRFENMLRELAEVNIPFYIRRTVGIKEYQNVYAKVPGSTQCPTAGLHFTAEMLEKIKAKGVDIVFITLHIGGSVLPLIARDFKDVTVHKEYFEISGKARDKINAVKRSGGRVVAVGTTVVRALESAADNQGIVHAGKRWTDLTIKSDYRFKVTDCFLTNFHLPGSSHLLMTSAFGGMAKVLSGYKEAVKKQYKFLDFGDAMLII